MFLKNKRGQTKQSTARAYEYPTKHFIQFLEDHGIENTHDIDGYIIERWKSARQDEVAPATYKTSVKRIKTFIHYCERSQLVASGTFDAIEVPRISREDSTSNKTLNYDVATRVLGHLETYEYASRRHTILSVLWNTGCRVSEVIALDTEDVSPSPDGEHYVIDFIDRQSSGTALKNGTQGERRVTISRDLHELIQDYKDVHREVVVDDYGREPLFTTPTQRISRQRIYKNLTAITRPCVYSGRCPHEREIDDCKAAQKKKQAFSCPSAKSTHPVRRGSITHHLNSGWPKQDVSDRCDVSLDVLEKHYNEQTKEDERKQRLQYVENL